MSALSKRAWRHLLTSILAAEAGFTFVWFIGAAYTFSRADISGVWVGVPFMLFAASYGALGAAALKDVEAP